MNSYRVVWQIDVEADSYEDAAKQAKEIQLDPESAANVFHITESTPTVTVDLDE